MVIFMYDYKNIIKQIAKYEYISFDVFDTLIKRNIENPTDLFDLVQKIYNQTNKPLLENFKEKRIEAERKARELSSHKEPNIDDIYKIIDIDNKKQVKELEIKLEINICQQNKDFYSIYNYAKQSKKKIIITSDMYLRKETLEEILSNANIKYDYLFLSNDIKLNKHNGKIYPYILKKLNIKPSQLLHIGDSKRSDYIIPKLYRIKSILIPKKINKLRYYKDYKANELSDNIIKNYINNNLPLDKDIYYQIGYEILGIILLGYSNWLKDSLQKEKINKVFFLSREGALLKKAFDLINNTKIETKYLYLSRRSTRPSLLKNINNLEEVFDICKTRRIIDLESFFMNVGLNINDYNDLIKKYNITKNINIDKIENFDKLFDSIKKDILKNAKREEKNLLLYLNSQGFKDKIAISDIGWSGTMQSSLINIAYQNKIDVDITGYYVGQLKAAYKNIKKGDKQFGYLFNYESDEMQIRAFISLFENLFSCNHGTTIKYEEHSGIIKPILADYEHSDKESKIFETIQEGALDFVKNFQTLNINLTEFNISFVSYGIKRLGINPTLFDVKLFGDITYLDTKIFYLAKPRNIIYYIIRPKMLLNDLLNSNWKVGFLKRLFKIKLNYYKIYKLMAGGNK